MKTQNSGTRVLGRSKVYNSSFGEVSNLPVFYTVWSVNFNRQHDVTSLKTSISWIASFWKSYQLLRWSSNTHIQNFSINWYVDINAPLGDVQRQIRPLYIFTRHFSEINLIRKIKNFCNSQVTILTVNTQLITEAVKSFQTTARFH